MAPEGNGKPKGVNPPAAALKQGLDLAQVFKSPNGQAIEDSLVDCMREHLAGYTESDLTEKTLKERYDRMQGFMGWLDSIGYSIRTAMAVAETHHMAKRNVSELLGTHREES